MNKVLYWLRGLETLVYLVLVGSTVAIGAIIQLVAFVFLFPVLFYDKYFFHKLGNRVVFTLMNFVVFYVNRNWKCVILTDLPRRDPKKRRIYMFNHLSAADPFVSTFIGKHLFTTCLYKNSVNKGYPKILTDLIGQVPIYFEYNKETKTKTVKKECVIGVMDRCKLLMDNGFDLFVYPEGTRTKTGKLQEFKDGFFRFSLDYNFEIVPCAVHNTKGFLSKHFFALTSTCYLMVGNPISPKGKNLEELKLEVRKQMYQLIKTSPKFDPAVETVEELE